MKLPVVASNTEAVEGADVVILAVKPQMLARVGREIGPRLREGQLVLSVLAGPTTHALTTTLGHGQVVRAMPNTPARIGNGMTVWYATPATTADQREQARALLGALGAELEVEDERWVAMATAVSGTGPAYVFLLIETLAKAGIGCGLPAELAWPLARATVAGSGALAAQSEEAVEALRRNVTSPGGTTQAALEVLMAKDGIEPLFQRAIAAATRRSRELA